MDKMKVLAVAAAAAALSASCVRLETTGANDGNKRYFDAWMKINHPDAVKEGLGVYILEETVGTGQPIGDAEDYPYASVTYTSTDLEGNITETTDAVVAQKAGSYDSGAYYGPVVKLRSMAAFTAGQEMVISKMRVGGTRKAVIPGWFATTYRFKEEKDYLDAVTGEDCIYTVTLHEVIKDMNQWQIDSIFRYITRQYHHHVDSLKYGFYYIQTQEPSDTTSFESGTSVQVNYTGMLLNGKVFDTTDKNTAKDAGIYTSGSTYSPMKVTMNSEYTEITTSSGDSTGGLIDGMAYCLSLMRTGEKGTCIFISDLGYQAEASGSIPAYSPLRFDVEMLGYN